MVKIINNGTKYLTSDLKHNSIICFNEEEIFKKIYIM